MVLPSCTPSASCQPSRCHPAPPPCYRPEACLWTTKKKRIPPCASAVAIEAAKSKLNCGMCGRFNDSRTKDARKVKVIKDWLSEKEYQNRLAQKDRMYGTNRLEKYMKKKGTPRLRTDCCAHHGHRGRLRRPGCCSSKGPRKRIKPKRVGKRTFAGGRHHRGCCTIL